MAGTGVKVVLRFDASVEIGGGHAVRCLALLDVLSKVVSLDAPTLFTNPEALDVIAPYLPDCVKVVLLPRIGMSSEAQVLFLEEQLTDCVDLLIVDHYGLDSVFETAARKWTRQVFVFDDLCSRPHNCDYILDQTAGREEAAYKSLNAHEGGVYFCGSQWALLREEFSEWRETSLRRRRKLKEVSRILISAGATDPVNLTETYLRALTHINFSGDVDVVLGGQAPFRDKVRCLAQELNLRVRFLSDVQDMAQLLCETDFVLGAAGSSALERCVLGVPSALSIVADNQLEICQNLGEMGGALNFGNALDLEVEVISKQIETVISDLSTLTQMSEKAASLCDGRGRQRVCETVVRRLNETATRIE